jgi:uncharacterized protein YidB (DUF937 family)
MGFLDSLENFASQQMAQSDNPTAKIAGGLMQSLEQHPGGMQGVIDSLNQNGMGAQVAGQATTPDAIGQALGGTGLIENVAAKAGVSPQVAQEIMATVLPMVVSHFTQGGTQAPPQGGFAGLAGELLTKFL